MAADGNNLFDIAADVALAPYIAAEQRADQTRALAHQMEVQRASGVCWSGMAPDEAPTPRGFDAVLAAAVARKKAANSPRAHFMRAVMQLWQIGYAEEANKLDGIYSRSLADTSKPLDTAAVGAALLILNPLKGADAEAARDALSELLIAEAA